MARYLLHCTRGDGLIAAGTYLAAALALRRHDWPGSAPWIGGALAIAAGIGYTAVSEWVNVHIAGGWAYREAMPLVAGIGVTPLLQWVAVPALTLAILRWRAGAGAVRRPLAATPPRGTH